MKKILELELSQNSFFDKSYILNRIKLEADDKVSLPSCFLENAGVRFLLVANFHDAKIIQVTETEKYGNKCIVMQIDFKGTSTEFKVGYRKFNIYFIKAEFNEVPNNWRELYITCLDCASDLQKLIINLEVEYFTGSQAHQCLCEIKCNGIEVKPFE